MMLKAAGTNLNGSDATNKSSENIRNMSTSNNSNPWAQAFSGQGLWGQMFGGGSEQQKKSPYRHDPGPKLNQNMAYYGLDNQNNKVKKYITPQRMASGKFTKNYYVDDQGYYGGSVAGTPYYDDRKLKGSWSDTPDEFGVTRMENAISGPGKYVVKDRNGNFRVYVKQVNMGRNGAMARSYYNYALPEGIDPYTMKPIEQKPASSGLFNNYFGDSFNKYFGDYMRSLGG